MNFNKGGTGYISGRVVLPLSLLKELSINQDDNGVKIYLEDKKIIIEKE